MSLAHLGRFVEAAVHATEAIRKAEPTHRGITIGLAYHGACNLHLLKGEWGKARPLFDRWISVIRSKSVLVQLPFGLPLSAWVLAQLGEEHEALNRLRESEQVLEHSAAQGVVFHQGWGYHALGRVCLMVRHLDDAKRLGNRAIEYSTNNPGFAAYALHLLGDIAAHPDQLDADSGEALYRQALTLAEQRGMRPLIGHCHFGLGRLDRRTGKQKRAQENLAIAMAMYREMGMTYWLEQAEEELRQLG